MNSDTGGLALSYREKEKPRRGKAASVYRHDSKVKRHFGNLHTFGDDKQQKKQPSKKALLGNSVVRLTETVQCVIHSVVIKKTYPVAAMSELEKYY